MLRFLATITAGIVMTGCGGSEQAFVPVQGRIAFQGSPLAQGTVSFRPDAAKGNLSKQHPTGAIDAAGQYELHTAGEPGALPGWYRVVIFSHQVPMADSKSAHAGLPKSAIPVKYNSPTATPLTIEVITAAEPGHYNFILNE